MVIYYNYYLGLSLPYVTGKQSSDIYRTPKDHGPSFGVMHYAGMVTYDLNGMLDKNRDAFPKSFSYLMRCELTMGLVL